MPPRDDPFSQRLWDLQVDTLDKLRVEVAQNSIEIAVIKSKIALVSAIIGLTGGVLGSIVSGVVIYIVKKA